jgi:hypothetical protein
VPVYFDTNIIHYLRDGLRGQSLSQTEKDQVVLSPISVLELISQIATFPNEALGAIHALRAWLDTERTSLLGWRDVFIAHWIFAKEIPDEVSEGLKRVLKVCYESENPDDKLRGDSGALSEFLERAKHRKATLLENAARAIRQTSEGRDQDNLRGGTRLGIARALREVVATSDEVSDDVIVGCLPAYFEYHTGLIVRAFPNDEFNFFSRKHLNDHFDAEQLIFLADPSLHFFTADQGYRCAARVEPRVHILEANQVRDPVIAPNLMTAEIRKLPAMRTAG